MRLSKRLRWARLRPARGRHWRVAALALLCTAALCGMAAHPAHSDSSPPAAVPAASPSSRSSSLFLETYPTISSNPGATNFLPGTGLLGRLIGFTPESGVRIGGVWAGNTDYLFTGGEKPRTWAFNSLLVLDLNLDLEKIVDLPGASVNCSMLQFNGGAANSKAGLVTGYDGLVGTNPLERTELYELWWRQEFFDDKFFIRIGKQVTTVDFNNVSRPIDVSDPTRAIPAVTSLIYTPIFKNPTMIGTSPGYYNSAYGITAEWAPNKNFYLEYGFYDGALARHVETGLKEAPVFDGHYFMIGEAGYAWLLGERGLPGKVAMGGWVQTGEMYGPEELQPGGMKPKYEVSEEGAQGAYSYASQRVWFRHPGIDNSGVSAFYQFGFNQSQTMRINRFLGLGATGFGLVPGRPSDSMGAGLAWSWLNRRYGFRSNEAMFQWYYQMHLISSTFLQPVISYIPNPGSSPQIQGAVAATVQLIVLF